MTQLLIICKKTQQKLIANYQEIFNQHAVLNSIKWHNKIANYQEFFNQRAVFNSIKLSF